jgi:hypothetical protein
MRQNPSFPRAVCYERLHQLHGTKPFATVGFIVVVAHITFISGLTTVL